MSTSAAAPSAARTSGSQAGRVTTTVRWTPSAASWPTSRPSTVPPCQGSSAAGPPSPAGAVANSTAAAIEVPPRAAGGVVEPAGDTTALLSLNPLVKAVGA